jgi:hypothetical protein
LPLGSYPASAEFERAVRLPLLAYFFAAISTPSSRT